MNIPIISCGGSSCSLMIHPSFHLVHIHFPISLYEFWFLGFNMTGITHYIPSSWRAGETKHTALKVECAQLQCKKPWEALSPTLKTIWIKCGRTHLQPQYSGDRAGGSEVHEQPQLHSLRPTWNAWDNLEIPKPAKQLPPPFFFLVYVVQILSLTIRILRSVHVSVPGLILWCCCVIS